MLSFLENRARTLTLKAKEAAQNWKMLTNHSATLQHRVMEVNSMHHQYVSVNLLQASLMCVSTLIVCK